MSSVNDLVDMLVKRICQLTRTAGTTDLTDGEFVAVDKTDAYTRKMTVGNLATWVLGRIKSLSTTITAFRTGDVIPVDGPSGTAKMSKDDLLQVARGASFSKKESSDASVNLGRTFRAGQKILIVALDTSGTGDYTINGNIVAGGAKYPAIYVRDGFGYVELTYDSDGTIGTFGGVGTSGKEIVFYHVVVDVPEESLFYAQFNDNILFKNFIKKFDAKIVRKLSTDYSVNLSGKFKANQRIMIVASDVSGSGTYRIVGNVNDGTYRYPIIYVRDGFGYVELTYDNGGTIGTFGGAEASGREVVFYLMVSDAKFDNVIDDILVQIESVRNSIPDIEPPEPFNAFRTLGIVGDSLGSGESVYKDSNNELHYVDNYDYSWIQILAKRNGQTAKNFSRGGEWCENWLNPNNSTGIALAQANPVDCYFIGLGHNDSNAMHQLTQPLGSIDDVHVGEENLNPNSYYGNYSKIIAALKQIQNRCIIFCFTSPALEADDDAKAYNTAVRTIVPLYANCHLLDIANDASFRSSDFMIAQRYANHFSGPGYAYWASKISEYVNRYMLDNGSSFRGVQWIGTNYDIADGG